MSALKALSGCDSAERRCAREILSHRPVGPVSTAELVQVNLSAMACFTCPGQATVAIIERFGKVIPTGTSDSRFSWLARDAAT